MQIIDRVAAQSLGVLLPIIAIAAQVQMVPAPDTTQSGRQYILGPQDQLSLWVLGVDEISEKPFQVDWSGFLDLPLAGKVRAAGLTVEQLKMELMRALKPYVHDPQLTVTVTESRSQPVSVIGAVKTPGVYQLQGGKTLVEILSLAGGLRPDAGNALKLSRRVEQGRIPLPGVHEDVAAGVSVAEIWVEALIQADNPKQNVVLQPYDVISVPRADVVYVIGEVVKAGGFVLNERERVSVLQALSMAGGLTPLAAAGSAKILRQQARSLQRDEIAVDLKKLLAGKAEDAFLLPNDVLFVPNSIVKTAGRRALETALQLGVGIAIWRR